MLSDELKQKYQRLRKDLDQEISGLEELHHKHMLCKKGCALCCLSFKVFPIEFEAIASEVDRTIIGKRLENAPEDTCPLLVDNSCTIYASRPFICRTHGLPLLYMNDEEWVLSHCELNFTEVDEDYFSESRFHEQDRWNSKLYMLNQVFLESLEDDRYEDHELVPLKELLNINKQND